MRCLIQLLIIVLLSILSLNTALASEVNNKFGIHIININKEEVEEAKKLVNSNGGDWGYVTFIIQSNDRDGKKWQGFFNELRRAHLIPIVRIATKPIENSWEVPRDVDTKEWADFLDSLIWPVDTRYVVIYNEPNHAAEWGNGVDPASYAKVLDETISALREKSDEFFALNAGFDASAPHEPPKYYDEEKFIREMNNAIPGIFEKLDGWSSHSYPNPAFSGSPKDKGRRTIGGYKWELDILKSQKVDKELPVFITETGWQRGALSPEEVGEYYEEAFGKVWNDPRIIAVTPFVLNYTYQPFDAFSFKVPAGNIESSKILGEKFPGFYPQYENIYNIPKIKGEPTQKHEALSADGPINSTLIPGQNYYSHYTFTNNGLSIWGEDDTLDVVVKGEGIETEVKKIKKEQAIEPRQEYEFFLRLKPLSSGNYSVELALEDSKGPIEGSKQIINLEAIGRIEQIKRIFTELLQTYMKTLTR